tara:strand:+ start:454 stop:762 length:309 start_codon:yes stop_codon:yes gene_type:complete
VSVWRKLRRLKEKFGVDSIIEKSRKAADENRRHDYVNAMSGVFAKRKGRPLKLAYDKAVNIEKGEYKLGHYDDASFKYFRIRNRQRLRYEGKMITTRFLVGG